MASSVLIIAAHPDDEILGCGGTMARHAEDGEDIHVLFIADGVTSRGQNTDMTSRMKAAAAAAAHVGTQAPRFLNFPDNRLDAVPLLEIIQPIEQVLAEIKPRTVYTHHCGDLNIDHALVSRAVLTACRPVPGQTVRQLSAFEIPSSTEWSGPTGTPPFIPTYFIDISKHLECKLKALYCYEQEMRPFPNPRSREGLTALARLRGTQAGVQAAEAFVILRQIKTSIS